MSSTRCLISKANNNNKILEINLQLESKLKQVNKLLFGILDMVASNKDVFVFSQDLIAEIVKASKSK